MVSVSRQEGGRGRPITTVAADAAGGDAGGLGSTAGYATGAHLASST